MLNIIFLGPPGSGKGTQSSLLSNKLQIKNISTGDILRDEINSESILGKNAKSYTESGNLVPDSIMAGIIKEKISKSDCNKGFILDGFPRNIKQAFILDEMFVDLGLTIDVVINIEINESVLIKRISGRFSCSQCFATYNSFFNPTSLPGKCDKCGGKHFLSRSDDKLEIIQKRLNVYNENIRDLLLFYGKKNLICSVDGLKSVASLNDEIMEKVTKR